MVKFGGRTGENRERKVVGIGISRHNWELLLLGRPIHFAGEEVGADGIDVVIVGGEDEETIARELREESEKAGVPIRSLEEALRGDPDPSVH